MLATSNPSSLCGAQNGEVGELNECFQWKGEVPPGLPNFTAAERAHVVRTRASAGGLHGILLSKCADALGAMRCPSSALAWLWAAPTAAHADQPHRPGLHERLSTLL